MIFSHLKISTRLMATFAVLLSLMLGLSLFIYVSSVSVQRRATEVTDDNIPVLQSVADMGTSALRLRTNELKYAFTTDIRNPEQKRNIETQMKGDISRFEAALTLYRERARSADERGLADQLRTDFDRMKRIHEQLLSLIEQQQTKQVSTLFETEGAESRAAIEGLITKVYDNEAQQTTLASGSLKSSFTTMQVMLGLGCLIALVFATISGWMLIRYLSNAFVSTINVARRIAAGNLIEAVEGREQHNEIGQLLHAMDDMRTSLATTVASVRENADGVASASEQIARGNADLSNRTEDQASALEETASAMEQLSATIKQNTDNAMNADRLAQDASKVANNGGDIVKRVVSRMHDINEGAERVVEVISLLDSIAFQTNLLALNASVEAARAGEQGRGFAVVASEVRNLAQRSAEASREIGSLITESVTTIRSGTELANEAGGTMDDVVRSVDRLKDIMSEISAASHEQNQGVSQVTTAVTQMDQTTQQNAALVEESAAAASSLYEQARVLQETVQVFKISIGHDFSTVSRQSVTRKSDDAPRKAESATTNGSRKDTASQPARQSTPGGEAARASSSHQEATRKPQPVKASHDDNDDWETF